VAHGDPHGLVHRLLDGIEREDAPLEDLLIDKMLRSVCAQGASALHLVVGSPPMLWMAGELRPMATHVLGPEDTESLMKLVTPQRCRQELEEGGGTDFGFAFGEEARFQVAISRRDDAIGMVLRRVPWKTGPGA
jgi:twitching motility protein PilT